MENDKYLEKNDRYLEEIMSVGREEKQNSQKRLKEQLGEPHLFDHFEDSPSENDGHCYWRVKGGIVRYRRFPNGELDPYSRAEFTDDFVKKLHGLLSRKPIG